MGNFKIDEVKIVDLKERGGNTEEMKKAIDEEIKIWMDVKSVSISDDRKTAVILFERDTSTYEKIIARAADLKLDENIPC